MDREAVSEQLRVAAGEGRITLEELEERLEGVYAAKTYAELGTLVGDLPRRPAIPDVRPLVLETRSGKLRQEGRWVVPELITAKVTMGRITIDFTGAVCRHREVRLAATCGSGRISVIVPHGWLALIDEVTTSMGHVVNNANDPGVADPVTILRVSGKIGMGHLRIKYGR
jgi:hypothetical protein